MNAVNTDEQTLMIAVSMGYFVFDLFHMIVRDFGVVHV